MKEVDLGIVVHDIILKFNQQRTMARPAVLLSIPSNLSRIPWRDNSLERLVQAFLYHALLMNDPSGSVRVAVHERVKLRDLEEFLELHPFYWVQLRIEGQESPGFESVVEEIFDDFGYRCEKWEGMQNSDARLAVFGFGTKNEPKMVCYADNSGTIHKYDFLIPVTKTRSDTILYGERKKF